tara:strand:+ start:12655 stop:13092 length:438 start_codon:yes stop_codon:yes gene_type:complete
MIEATIPASEIEHVKPERTGTIGGTAEKAMGMEDFLRLLTTQIANQDPMEPMKDTEFIAQMASISSVEQMQQFATSFKDFTASHREIAAQAYLGKQVTAQDGESMPITGIAQAVEKGTGGELLVTVNGQTFPAASITKIELVEKN